ncbi:unnamed protein product [Mytilus edulis]|uniref:AIG1-type G domain-containing protein n=1 Tax=Mytilus edulis TaxID=6550 RepID=A0A8S3QVI1_MYTED|nr:unnamed protein product [Mytilus edulis]
MTYYSYFVSSFNRNGPLTIILIGTKGSGKSSAGNCILEQNRFNVFVGTKIGTTELQTERKVNSDTDICVIDTPGIRDIEEVNSILENLKETENVVYAIIISIGRYTTLDKHLLYEIERNCEHILKKSFVLFTRRNELKVYENPHERTIDNWLKTVQTLSKFIDSHQLQFRVFENVDVDSLSKAEQVRDVIELCKEILSVTVSTSRETSKNNIIIEFDEMKKAFW